MTSDDVKDIAKKAALAAGYSFELIEPQPCRAGERLKWTVDSATIGSCWRLEIDDATGVAVPVERWGPAVRQLLGPLDRKAPSSDVSASDEFVLCIGITG